MFTKKTRLIFTSIIISGLIFIALNFFLVSYNVWQSSLNTESDIVISATKITDTLRNEPQFEGFSDKEISKLLFFQELCYEDERRCDTYDELYARLSNP